MPEVCDCQRMPDGQQEKKEERKRKGFRKEPADGQKSGQKKKTGDGETRKAGTRNRTG